MARWSRIADMAPYLLRVVALFAVSVHLNTASQLPPSPCVAWVDASSNRRCTSQRDFYACNSVIGGGSPSCPEAAADSEPVDPSECALVNGSCAFISSTQLPSCFAWNSVCSTSYICGTTEDYNNYLNEYEGVEPSYLDYCPSHTLPPPPTAVCIAINQTCQFYDPCLRRLSAPCGEAWLCGTEGEFWSSFFGPQPARPCSLPREEAIAPGECVWQNETVGQNGTCRWSECSTWVGTCGNWECNTEYEYQRWLSLPPTPCPFAGPTTQPLVSPANCFFNESTGSCTFNQTCPAGMQYLTCGSACPITCDNVNTPPLVCLRVCVQGCFCPDGLIEMEGVCVTPEECPGYEMTCKNVQCPFGQCQEGSISGSPPLCIEDCSGADNHCGDEQMCLKVQRACQIGEQCLDHGYPTCHVPPASACPSSAACEDGQRCLQVNSTGKTYCLPSCYHDNGGCGQEQACIVEAIGDAKCFTAPKPCTALQCTDIADLVGVVCPPGKTKTDCGSFCPATCQTILQLEPLPCPAICVVDVCICPPGLVEFRDRCVDPLECFELVNDPPSLNPLPLFADSILIKLVVTTISREDFKDQENQLTSAVSLHLTNKGYSDFVVVLYAVIESESSAARSTPSLDVVLKITFEHQSAPPSSQIASVIASGIDSFGVEVAEVTAVDAPSLPSNSDLSTAAVIGIAVGAVIAVVAAVVAIAIIAVIAYGRICTQATTVAAENPLNEDSKEVNTLTYSKLKEAAKRDNGTKEETATSLDA